MGLRHLLHDRSGSSAAEFALLLPLLIVLLFGMIDGGRLLWTFNEAEKATQIGARTAAVVDPVASGITTASFVGVNCNGTPLKAGDTVCAAALPDVTCDNINCTCTGCPSGLPGTYNSVAFNDIVNRMKALKGDINAAQVEVVYRGSNLGYAGDPFGANVSPLVTVRLKSLKFQPLTGFLFAKMDLPSFSTTMTAEDLTGNVAD